MKILGLASLQRAIARQRSRLLWLSEGGANTEFFHIQACHRRKKNCIMALNHNGMTVEDEHQKEDIIFSYFDQMLGCARDWEAKLNFESLGILTVDLSSIDGPFTEEEVWKVVSNMPPEKAPGPDGFTGLFYKVAWHIIKHHVLRAFNALAALNTREFHHTNDAYMVLLPVTSHWVAVLFTGGTVHAGVL